MNYQTIADIYAANEVINERLIETLNGIPEEVATEPPEGEKWTVGQIAEHIAIVESNIIKICARMLKAAEADGKTSTGAALISESFIDATSKIADVKLEAPDRVKPTGEVSIGGVLEMLRNNREQFIEIQPLFESFDGTDHKFPHPYFGELSAHEWLTLAGGHKARHAKQIRRLLEKDS